MLRSVARVPSRLLLLALPACVAYEPAPLELALALAATPQPPPGELTFASAVAFAIAHNPELQRLAAEARAAGADVPASDAQLQWDGHDETVAAMVDPVALLRFGPRGAAAAAADTRRDEALAALAVARWRIAGDLAAVFASLAALATVTVPAFEQDPQPFERAGLASPTAAALARAASAAATAERLTLASEREALLAQLRTLLGVAADAAIAPAPVDAAFPRQPDTSDAQLLRRPDLALALARYRTADAEFRAAVAAQYPSLMIGPDLAVRPGVVEPMVVLRLPLGAAGPALAARDRRDAARAQLAGDVLAASNDARALTAEHPAVEQRAAAAAASAAASRAALAAAQQALAVEVDAFAPLVERAQRALRDAMEHRQAAVAAARHRVREATAWSWPLGPEGER